MTDKQTLVKRLEELDGPIDLIESFRYISLPDYKHAADKNDTSFYDRLIMTSLLDPACNKGNYKYFADRNFDIRSCMLNMYESYKGELIILNYMNDKNPDRHFEFINEDNSCYVLNHSTNNQPDIIETTTGKTIEVKTYKVYGNKIYFNSIIDNISDMYAHVLHNADYIAILDKKTLKKGCLMTKQYFLDHVKCYPCSAFDLNKTCFEVEIPELSQIYISFLEKNIE